MESEILRKTLKEAAPHGSYDFPVAIYNNSFNKDYNLLAPLHYHNELELLLSTKGNVLVQIEDKSYLLNEGEGIFINKGQLHMISSDTDTGHGFIAIVFDYKVICSEFDIIFKNYIRPLINNEFLIPIRLSSDICNHIYNINSAFNNSYFGYEIYVKEELLNILFSIIKGSSQMTKAQSNSKSVLVKNIIDYIETNYKDPISLNDMSEHVHISREYLCRIFSMMSEDSPIVYLNKYRIRKSAHELIYSDKTISEIGFLCGFNDSSYFNKLFLRFIGTTPSKYRKSGGK